MTYTWTCAFFAVSVAIVTAVVLASFVRSVKGEKLYDLSRTRVVREESVFLVRNPANHLWPSVCVEVRLTRGCLLLGNLKASLEALLSPLILSFSLKVVE